MHSFGIVIKEKCSPFNQGIIHQPIMSINKVITPMTELSDPPSYTKPKAQISSAVADQNLCFRYSVQFCFLLNPKFQGSSLFLGLNKPGSDLVFDGFLASRLRLKVQQ